MTLDNVQEVLHLTPTQAGMLFHSTTAPRSGSYVAQIRCMLAGPLDVEAFKGSWDAVVRRHPALRAAFVWDGVDEPLQVVRREVTLDWTELDWRVVGDAERTARLEEYLAADRRRGFDLSGAPLMRMHLVREGDETYRFVWTCHHIIADGWSATVVLREVFDRYGAALGGATRDLPASTGFQDYLGWLRRLPRDRDEAFWTDYLSGFSARTSVPPDRAPARLEEPGLHELIVSHLSREDSDALRRRGRQARLTLNTLLQGAWSILLHRYSGEEDVVSGTAVAGRPAELPGVGEAVGLFINTLPVRVRVENERPVRDWLLDLQESLLSTREHQHASLVDIQGWSDVTRGEPLFDHLMVLENVPEVAEDLEAAGVRVREIRILDASNYPLAVVTRPGPEIEQIVVYDPTLYSAAAARRIVTHFQNLLRAFGAGLEGTVGSFPLMTKDESRRLLVEWNDTGSVAADVDTVLELVSRHAREAPTRTAVSSGPDRASYAELERRSDEWARRLVDKGVVPGDSVGLMMERGPGLIIGIVAILKAGAAYVPLDPAYPADRLEWVLADSGARLVLTSQGAGRSLPVDSVMVEAPKPVSDAALPTVTAERNAYVIYTSGSTGEPKGVPVRHRNLLRSTLARPDYYGDPPSVFLLLSSVAFDSSVAGIFWTLTSGGTLVVPEGRAEQDMTRLAGSIAEHGVTHTLMLPSVYEALLDHARDADLGSLRTVILAGEPLPPSVVRRHREALPSARLFNEYGPTEATVWCSVYDTAGFEGGVRVPIGRPIAGARIYLLDHGGRPVPIGVAGEIHVAGDGLTDGYLNRPEATAERFVQRMIAGRSMRLYRTGDLGRYRPDGNIEFLGRMDRQIKVRGYRVEPGEIEAALERHRGVRDAVVVPVGARIDPDSPASLTQALARLDPAVAEELLASVEEPGKQAIRGIRDGGSMKKART